MLKDAYSIHIPLFITVDSATSFVFDFIVKKPYSLCNSSRLFISHANALKLNSIIKTGEHLQFHFDKLITDLCIE